MNDQVKSTIETLEDILSACVIDLKVNWYNHQPLIEFSYNNCYHSSISMDPFEELYGKRCRSLVWRIDVGESSLLGPEINFETLEKVRVIRDRLKIAYSRRELYADNKKNTFNLK